MPVAKLTKRVVDAIETSSRRVIYYDSELKGFGVKITPTGAKRLVRRVQAARRRARHRQASDGTRFNRLL